MDKIPLHSIEFEEFHFYHDKDYCFIKAFLEGQTVLERYTEDILKSILQKVEVSHFYSNGFVLGPIIKNKDIQGLYDFLVKATKEGSLLQESIDLIKQSITDSFWYSSVMYRDSVIHTLQKSSLTHNITLGLFGSFARSEENLYSDVDVILFDKTYNKETLQYELSKTIGRFVQVMYEEDLRPEVHQEAFEDIILIKPERVFEIKQIEYKDGHLHTYGYPEHSIKVTKAEVYTLLGALLRNADKLPNREDYDSSAEADKIRKQEELLWRQDTTKMKTLEEQQIDATTYLCSIGGFHVYGAYSSREISGVILHLEFLGSYVNFFNIFDTLYVVDSITVKDLVNAVYEKLNKQLGGLD